MARKTASYWSSRSLSGDVGADRDVELELHAQALDQLDLAVEHGLGQAVLGQRVAQHAAGCRVAIRRPSRCGPAAPGRTRRPGRSGRRPPPPPCCPVGASFRAAMRSTSAVEAVRVVDRVGDEAVHVAHVHRLVDRRARRQRLSQGCWQTRPVEAGSGLSSITDFERFLQPALLVELRGSAGCSCAAGNCSRRARAPGPRTRRRGSAWRGCGPRTRGGSAAWW